MLNMRGTLLIVLWIALWPITTKAQQRTYLGDALFEHNKNEESLISDTFYTHVEIGKLFSATQKHAVIFQQIDSLKYINELKLITYSKGEIIQKTIDTFEIGMFADFRRIDMNHDGYKDILITQGSQRSWDRLYLFDPVNDSLLNIPEFREYRSTEPIGETGYFYSYTSRGCADAEWESKLIRIEGTDIVEYGTIFGDGCYSEEDKRLILITHGDVTKYLSLEKTLSGRTDKWSFIETYWQELVFSK
ncbi:MAG: hypothetical protein Roseis2KO_27800 [Roseivirga sp.]